MFLGNRWNFLCNVRRTAHDCTANNSTAGHLHKGTKSETFIVTNAGSRTISRWYIGYPSHWATIFLPCTPALGCGVSSSWYCMPPLNCVHWWSWRPGRRKKCSHCSSQLHSPLKAFAQFTQVRGMYGWSTVYDKTVRHTVQLSDFNEIEVHVGD